MTRDADCDLLVIGSGAGGLAAAVTAAHLGRRVLVVEKEPVFGGTTAWSGGWLWIPRNRHAIAAGIVEDESAPLTYLRHELGAQFSPEKIAAFLRHGPRMVDFFERNTALQFIDGNAIPDFHGRTPGAGTGGRSLCAAPYDARGLGARVRDLRLPLDLVSLWGMGIASGPELRHFLNAMRSWRSFAYATRRVTVHLKDRVAHGRGMRVVNGNALVARLARSAFDRGVELWLASPARRLLQEGGRVAGALIATPQGDVAVHAHSGVVLACGGFPHDVERRRALFAHAPTGREHWSAAAPSNTGDGLALGEGAGGVQDRTVANAGAWAPVSLVPRADGTTGHFPHLIERAKPGVIMVTRAGKRFANEADSYHDVMSRLFAAVPAGEPVAAWLVCDHRFVRRYGLGAVKPSPMPLRRFLRSGYLQRAATIDDLAARCGIDRVALRATVDAYNAHARDGRDPEFDRGGTPYNRVQGDAGHAPNPCVAPIERAPFYAVKTVPGSLGTFAGLATDANARVLDRDGAPIAGLFACGNDMSSVMGGHYPAGGITLGPALTFGYIAAHVASGVPLPNATA